MRLYEGMFLFDNAFAHEWSAIDAEVRRLCERINAELLVCVKFDERRLAYELNKRKRGTYVLTYFNADPTRIVDLERDVQLSESVLRVLVLRPEDVGPERIKELQEHQADQPLLPSSDRDRRYDDRDAGRDRDRRGPRHDRDRDRDRDRGRDRDREPARAPEKAPEATPAETPQPVATEVAPAPDAPEAPPASEATSEG